METSRDRILSTIRTGLERNRAELAAMSALVSHIPPGFVHPQADDLAAQFAAELSRLEGHPHRCADDEEALEAIGEILRAEDARSVIAWDQRELGLPGLDGLFNELGVAVLPGNMENQEGRAQRLQLLETAPVCVSGADFGIAESGTLVLLHGAGRGRLASLLAPTHIAVLRAGQLRRGLGDVLAALKARYGSDMFNQSSNLTLITGPSRTADIELTLTLGVHGPKEIHVVLIDE